MSKLQLIYLSLLFATSFSSFAQMGIGTDAPDASAALDITSTTGGFLLPRMTLKQIQTIATPAEGLMVYCKTCKTKGVFVYDGEKFINIVNGKSMNFFDTTTEVKDVESPTTGKTWMDRNLGAAQAATSIDDQASYGDLYQWGRAKDGHESRDAGVIATKATSADPGHDKFISGHQNWTDFAEKDALWQSGLNDPCPAGYRIPTEAELYAEQFDIVGPYDSPLHLPLTGYREFTSSFKNVNSIGYYWSSTVNSGRSRFLNFTSNQNAQIGTTPRADAMAVRCIKKE